MLAVNICGKYGITFLSDCTHVKHLATSLDVRVVSANHLALTRKIGLWQVVEVQILRNTHMNISVLSDQSFHEFSFSIIVYCYCKMLD